jgi:predicted kinase
MEGFTRISQDDFGGDRGKCMAAFKEALLSGKNVVVDRMGFNKAQRQRFICEAKPLGYFIKVINFNIPKEVCLARAKTREGHPTLSAEVAPRVINMFYTDYEEPSFEEGIDLVENRFTWSA